MGTQTPWGKSDYSSKYARGIIFYGTPGHGGFHLSPTRNALVHPAWRRNNGWYEEDVEWAIAALTFPDVWIAMRGDQKVIEHAHSTAKNYYPHEYETVTGKKVSLEESVVLREEADKLKYVDSWIATAAWGDWHPKVPKGMVAVVATKGAQRPTMIRTPTGWVPGPKPEEKWFMVSAERYNPRNTALGYLIDESLDAVIEPIEGKSTKERSVSEVLGKA